VNCSFDSSKQIYNVSESPQFFITYRNPTQFSPLLADLFVRYKC